MREPRDRAEQLHLDSFEPDVERLMRIPAWERAKLMDAAGLDLAQREYLEIQVRARIRAATRRRYGRRS
jgi:hypothetical protein